MDNLNVREFIEESGVEKLIGEGIFFSDNKNEGKVLVVKNVNYSGEELRNLKVGNNGNNSSSFIYPEDFKYYFIKKF